jgi:hypothetical protein
MDGRARTVGAVLAAAALAIACGGEPPEPERAARPMAPTARSAKAARPENRAPVVEAVELSPSEPRPGQRVEAIARASDPDGDALRLRYEWRVDGRALAVDRSTFEGSLEKGSRLEVRVTASDGFAESEPFVARTRAGNRPPVLQSLAAPGGDALRPGDPLVIEPVASDPDGDELEFSYTWFVDGEEQDVEGPSFPTDRLRRGERLRVRVVASDGIDESAPMESPELEMANSAPRILGVPPVQREEGTFRFAFEAQDPDGDRSLRFRLSEAPPGMTIDPILGTASWTPGPGHAGVHPVEVIVADAYGAESALRFEVTVREVEAPAAEPAPAKAY